MKKFNRSGSGPQRGAAALIVVLLLFFIISLVAAYAGRNLIFEQRTSTNQYRATQAFEAAEAGLEWAVAMLNGGRVTADCIPPVPVDPAQPSFRQRYIDIDVASGNVTPVRWVDGVTAERPSCLRNGASWNCSCPAGAAPAPAVPAGGGVHAGFRVCFEGVDPPQPGVVRVVSTGRTSFVDEPCEQRGEGTAGEAAATVSVVVALSSALATPPRVALTVRGDLDVNDAMRLLPVFLPSRQDLDSIWMPSGRLVQVGGATMNPLSLVPNDVRGTPMATLVATDPALGSLSADQMFASMFKMNKASFKNQPATVVLNDCAAACTDKLLSAWQPSPGLVNPGRINPGKIIWVEGDMTIESDLILGSAEAPVLIMATGNINLDAASVSIVGVLYSQAASWNNAGLGDIKVQGAAVAEGDFVAAGVGSGGTEWLQYDPLVLRWLRLSTGSFVRVPGSWRDFP